MFPTFYVPSAGLGSYSAAGALLWVKFDEASGSFYDTISGNPLSDVGTFTRRVSAPAGLGGAAAAFTGSTSQVLWPRPTGWIGHDWTFEVWLRTTYTWASASTFYERAALVLADLSGPQRNDFGWAIASTGRMNAGIGTIPQSDVTINSGTVFVNDGQWHHLAFTRDYTTGMLRLYVDGVLATAGAAEAGDSKAGAATWWIGLNYEPLYADVCHLAVWDRRMLDSELLSRYNAGMA